MHINRILVFGGCFPFISSLGDLAERSIFTKTFKGELVEQLPTDGDAKDLLEEIKALKESMKKPKKKRTTKKKVVLKEGEQSEIPFK